MKTTTHRTLAALLTATALLGGCAMTPEQEAGMMAALGAMSYTMAAQQQRQQQQQAYYRSLQQQQAYYRSLQPQTYTIRPTYPNMPGYYTVEAW